MLPTLLILCSTASAKGPLPTADALANSWDGLQGSVVTTAVFPIELTRKDFELIARGKVAKRRIREDGPDRAMGAMWTPVSRDRVWISILDDVHDTLVSSLTEHRLGKSKEGNKLLYQHLDLPWPVQDRQWVIEITNNRTLAQTTNNQLWERSWDLAKPALMPNPNREAVWVPVTTGSWLLFPVEHGTFVVYHARSAIGGRIPDEAVTRWALATLDEMMIHIADRAATIDAHYTEPHEIIHGCDEKPIPRFEE